MAVVWCLEWSVVGGRSRYDGWLRHTDLELTRGSGLVAGVEIGEERHPVGGGVVGV